jgi:hypothetical protein
MSAAYQLLDKKFPTLNYTDQDCVVEIGSYRWEGSTIFFRDWAMPRKLDFHTVDVCDDARIYIRQHGTTDGINFHITEAGSIWARDVLPTIGKQIKVLYLDNFDWLYEPRQPYMDVQIASYAARGVEMTNENSQKEHRAQALHCQHYMSPQSVIFCDDTWPVPFNSGKFDGKCGTAVPLFLEAGYKSVHEQGAMILYRGIEISEL